jgi:general L-amino acid transport system permease protein
MRFVILPQVFRVTLPASVNEFVTVLKETSVVAIVGLFDLTASANAAYQDGTWNPYWIEVYVFIAALYFVSAYSLGLYGAFLERQMRPSGT